MFTLETLYIILKFCQFLVYIFVLFYMEYVFPIVTYPQNAPPKLSYIILYAVFTMNNTYNTHYHIKTLI